VLAAEHLLDLTGLDFLIERFDGLRELRVHRLACRGPLEQHTEIVGALPQRRGQLAVLFETAAALQHALRFGLIFPEVGRGGARLEAVQFVGRVSAFKDSSAGQQRVG
jgi:hypothetical protein